MADSTHLDYQQVVVGRSHAADICGTVRILVGTVGGSTRGLSQWRGGRNPSWNMELRYEREIRVGALDRLNVEDHKDPLSIDWASGDVIAPCASIARSVRVSASALSSTAAETAPPPATRRGLHRVMTDPVYAEQKGRCRERAQ